MQIELETEILSAAIFFIVLAFGISVICFFRQRRYSKLLAAAGHQVDEMKESLTKIKEASDQNSRRLSEQSRHIAWLETRIRQPKLAASSTLKRRP